MPTYRTMMRAAVPALAALSLGGCGMFNSSGTEDKYEVNDPNRTATRVVANVVATTLYTEDAPASKAKFIGQLFDAEGRQFFGPEVLFEGAKVDPLIAGSTPARYIKNDVPYTTGKTYSVAVQGNSVTTPPAPPAMRVITPARTVVPDPNDSTKTLTLQYFIQEAGQGVTISWSGGDPSLPVYLIIYGDPTSQNGQNARRLYVKDNPQQSPTDPNNYGLPIPNTGSYTIPAELTERVVASDGSTTTRTVPTFGFPNPKARATDLRYFSIYVVQRTEVVKNGPLEASTISIAMATAGVKPPTAS